MALTKQITLNSGVTLTNAYIKISEMSYVNSINLNSHVLIKVCIFNSEADRNFKRPEVIQLNYKVTGNDFNQYFTLNVLKQLDKNIISQGYEFLKTISYYSDATDVIDTKE